MSSALEWLLVAVLAAAFNVTPILAPPTMGLLAYFHINEGMGLFPLALVGAASAALGKLTLGLLSRAFGSRLIPEKRRENIEKAVEALKSRKSIGFTYLALFAVGPIPKGTLFTAAGLANLPLVPGAIVFGITRFGIYLGTMLVAATATSSLENLAGMSVAGPLGIAVQLLSLVGVLLLFRLDWTRAVSGLTRIELAFAQFRARVRPSPVSK